jgi:predicted ribosome quality control (RQC) complex YloA/Tae2 family protein
MDPRRQRAQEPAEGDDERREALGKALGKAIARVERRAAAVRGDLEQAQASDELAQRAQLFVGEAARAQRGATRLVTVDWTSGEPREIELPLDPARGAREQLDALFRKARRRKDGARIARARLADAEKALQSLRAIAASLAEEPPPDLDVLEKRAKTAAPRDFKRPPAAASSGSRGARSREQPPLPPYRTFLATSGARILVGKGAEKNDALTFHVSRPRDLWLHAKNRTGAHVIVPLDKNATCPADVLVDAAHLAAHFSEARDESLVEVQHTPRRYLRKPRGSAPGLVVVDREKVLVLRRQDDRLRALLEREVDPSEATVTSRPQKR